MCGIVGIVQAHSRFDPRTELETMADTVRHRGPDSHGYWISPDKRVALGHRRLSIIDLSSEADQPMQSSSGDWTLTYNGEIYNYRHLRARLSAEYPFRTSSDTEVLLAALECWGIVRTLDSVVGMFAFAAWHNPHSTLHLACDRMGEKPLYYAVSGGVLAFGSELKALQATPWLERPLDRTGLAQYLRYGYVPHPRTIYQNAAKLSPAHHVALPLSVFERAPALETVQAQEKRYWDLRGIAAASAQRLVMDVSAAETLVEDCLEAAVSDQLHADVPVGAFLSGGIDSSLVCAVAAKQTNLHTFSVGFESFDYDEAPFAAAVAKALGTKHQQLYVREKEVLSLVDTLPLTYDEPFGDPSCLPTMLISRLAREHVKVCLSGDGGDELFAGYNRHTLTEGLHSRVARLPAAVRWSLLQTLAVVRPGYLDALGQMLRKAGLPVPSQLGTKVGKLALLMKTNDVISTYDSLRSYWQDPEQVLLHAPESSACSASARSLPFLQQALLIDQLDYLPNDNLVKVDRASMSASLETRLPFLDHRLVEASWSIPAAMKVNGATGKWLLRRLLHRRLPRDLVDRPKMGFSVPVGAWLRDGLKPWAESLLSTRALEQSGVFRPGPIRELWFAHQAGRVDGSLQLWVVLMFQAWWRQHASSA
jgi:asparagine synthase (glutamine-hydrolysing)